MQKDTRYKEWMEWNYNLYWFSNKELTNGNIALIGVFIFKQNKLSSGGSFTKYKAQEVCSFDNHLFQDLLSFNTIWLEKTLKKDCLHSLKLSNTIRSTPTQISEKYDAETPLDTMEFVLFRQRFDMQHKLLQNIYFAFKTKVFWRREIVAYKYSDLFVMHRRYVCDVIHVIILTWPQGLGVTHSN